MTLWAAYSHTAQSTPLVCSEMSSFLLSNMYLPVKVFAKPKHEQEEEVFFYSMMFLVIAFGAGVTMFLMVCITYSCCHRENIVA